MPKSNTDDDIAPITISMVNDAAHCLINAQAYPQLERFVAETAASPLDAVQVGTVSPALVDRVFTTLDAALTFRGGQSPLSPELHELLLEGEQFDHTDDEQLKPNVDRMRALIDTLRIRERLADTEALAPSRPH